MDILNRKAAYDVIGIGSALLDFIVKVDEADLAAFGLTKGGMQLIDEARSRDILSRLAGREMEIAPGGSAANTLAGLAMLGGQGVFLGTVGTDEHGDRYIQETEKSGVKSEISRHDCMTGHAITFITPDSERSFATHLGAALHFGAASVSEELIKKSRIIHFEGYLFEPPTLRDACMRAIEIAKRNEVLVSIDLSDPSLIERIRPIFNDVTREYADILFVNEEEAKVFTGLEREDALKELYNLCQFAVVKLGEDGSLIMTDETVYRIPAYRTDVVNTNGAGDMYDAGVLYGITSGLRADKAGKIGSYLSSKVVSQVGARLPGKVSIRSVS
jgi:sugar/nucleoside kinase (ribokinase family)